MGKLLLILALLSLAERLYACKGCVSLDEHSFAKILPKFKSVLVKFDVAYPYGDKHETYVAFGSEQAANPNLLVAEVAVKEYGDNENQDFAKQHDVDPKNFPVVKIFPSGKTFSGEFTIENLRKFVMDHSDLHLTLPGCLEAFDKLTLRFIQGDKGAQKEAEQLAKDLLDQTIAKIYLTYMNKFEEIGESFVKTEMQRLNKILKEGKLSSKKKEDLGVKLNVLYSFKNANVKEEL